MTWWDLEKADGHCGTWVAERFRVNVCNPVQHWLFDAVIAHVIE